MGQVHSGAGGDGPCAAGSISFDMMRIEGVVQRYAWGDHEAIPALLGVPPDGRPWAELWMGTHPVAPSYLVDVNGRRPLGEVTGALPFLFKVLAAAEPLSLQTHPDDATAQRGFAAEVAIGLAESDERRLYRDPFGKPEILCAVGTFEILCGFRSPPASIGLLRALGDGGSALADVLADGGIDAALRAIFVEHRIDPHALLAACTADNGRTGSVTAAIATIGLRYPTDPALAAAILLNHRVLRDGEAIFLGAGNLHAYLRGYGVELMDPSDNVLRAGFTAKRVEPQALLDVVDSGVSIDPLVLPRSLGGGVTEYPTPTNWRLRRIDVDGRVQLAVDAVGVLLNVHGTCAQLPQGQPMLITPGEQLTLEGDATIYWATAIPPERPAR